MKKEPVDFLETIDYNYYEYYFDYYKYYNNLIKNMPIQFIVDISKNYDDVLLKKVILCA